MSAAEGQQSAKLTVSAMKTDESFQQLWSNTLYKTHVSELVVPCYKKRPARCEEGTAEPHFLNFNKLIIYRFRDYNKNLERSNNK